MEQYDVIVIGAGISGLTAASLIAKRGKKVAVIDAQNKPGGSCGIFKRDGAVFEQGASMLYGFAKEGFNPHRFVFNVLEEPITMIRHNELYMIHFGEDDIIFYEEMDRFLKELVRVFPDEEKGIYRFYREMGDLYEKVIGETPVFVSPDVLAKEQAKEQFMRHPGSYLKFLGFMNRSMKGVLRSYFKGDKILEFFDKLTSTYCYATVEEAPAVLGAVMFIDNHVGGSYYPAGSTMQMIGKLEKVIEEHGGDMFYSERVTSILLQGKEVRGVATNRNNKYHAGRVIYSGNVWSLYEELLGEKMPRKYEPTYGSVVLYARVRKEVIPSDALPIEMFITDKSRIVESEITTYVLSIDEPSLCREGEHVLVAIGPTFASWPSGRMEGYHTKEYEKKKAQEMERMISVLERRYQGLRDGILYASLATPSTLERYILKYHGAVAGPKEMLGQHMMKRQHTKTKINGLYCCGEGTIMGTGTPAVTVSGISAANLCLREMGEREYTQMDVKKNYVTIVSPPYQRKNVSPAENCQFCEDAPCSRACPYHIPIAEVNRRVAAGNMVGARKAATLRNVRFCLSCAEHFCEEACIRNCSKTPVPIQQIITSLMDGKKQ